MPPRQELRRLPNLISLSRLILAAAFVAATPDARVALVIAAALTDFLDGWVARYTQDTTRTGALIDPIADRVFVLVAVSVFLFEGALTTFGYFVMISRDLMTAVGFLVARAVSWLRPVEFRARITGKVVTGLQLLTFIALLTPPTFVPPLLILVGIASAWAILDYTWALWRARDRPT